MKSKKFDVKIFWIALDKLRISNGYTWKQVAEQSGVSASTLSRIAQGKRPDVDSLTALITWARFDSRRFVGLNKGISHGNDSLVEISHQLRSDKSLDPEAAETIEAMVTAAYQRMRKKDGNAE